MKLLLLSKENISMAEAEAEALMGKGKLADNVLLMNTAKKTDRLAYTRLICNVVFEADDKNIEEKIKKYNWNKVIKGSFALEFIKNSKKSETLSRKYGGLVYDKLKNPKVDLETPKTKIIVVKNDKLYVTVLEWENKQDFNARKSQNRVVNLPISLNPKLARACVNLTGSFTSVYDPFCGIGGFLIEAGLMKLKVIGSDIDEKMVEATKENLKFFKIKGFVFQQNALKAKKHDYVVTDLPYGRNTKIVGDLSGFVKKLKFGKRAVVMLDKKIKIKHKQHFSIYIHKSMTKEIYVL